MRYDIYNCTQKMFYFKIIKRNFFNISKKAFTIFFFPVVVTLINWDIKCPFT